MNRNPTVSKRSLILFAVVLSAAISVTILVSRRKPRPFQSLRQITAQDISHGWTVEVPPDIDGPYRLAGDDWTAAGKVQLNPGRPVMGWVTSGGSKRTFSYPGRAGFSYLVAFLENADDQPTYLILSKPEQHTSNASGGG